MLSNSPNYQRGDTLIEVLVVAFILMTTLVALTSLTTISMARNRLAKERIVATRLAQQGLEWLKAERSRMGYDLFESNANQVNGKIYCILTANGKFENATQDISENCVVDSTYRRWVVFNVDLMNSKVTATVKVQWPSQSDPVELTGVFTEWQR